MCSRRLPRRGVTTVQFCITVGVVVLGIAVSFALMGTRTNTKLNQTASDMANPINLKTRFAPKD